MEASEYPECDHRRGLRRRPSRRSGRRSGLSQGPQGPRRDRVRRQRDRHAARHRDAAFTTTTSRRSCTSSTAARSRWSSATARCPRLEEGGLARVDAATVRKVRNVGRRRRRLPVAGGKDGYVGRDGRVPEGEEQRVRALHDLSAGQPSELCRRRVLKRDQTHASNADTTGEPEETERHCASTASWRSPSERSCAREPLLGAGRPARQRHRLARRSELRRARLALAERGTARAPARARRRRAWWRSLRTSARKRATASSPCAGSPSAWRGPARARKRRPTRPTAASRERRLDAKRRASPAQARASPTRGG